MFCRDCPAGIEVPWAARDRYGFPREELRRSERHRGRLRTVVDAAQPARLWHGHFHHRYQALLDGETYRTVVDGLGRSGDPIDNNMVVVNLPQLTNRWPRDAYCGQRWPTPPSTCCSAAPQPNSDY